MTPTPKRVNIDPWGNEIRTSDVDPWGNVRPVRINIDQDGDVIGGWHNNIQPGQPVNIFDRENNLLYKTKWDPAKNRGPDRKE